VLLVKQNCCGPKVFFKVMQEQGSTVERILDDRESNLALLSRFAAKQPHVMRIQQELFEGKTLSETAAASAVSRELAELQRQNLEKLSDVEVQAQKKIIRSSLEKVLTLHLERKTFDSTIHDLSAQQEEIREEQMEEDKKNDERMTKLQEEKHCQDQRFQVQLNDLNEKLRAIRASPGKRG
jgi:hypothetical protein